MILEGILTTINAAGDVNVAPMGPIVDEAMQSLVLRPYQTSRSFANLKRTGVGVFHVVDDVELLAHAAVGQFDVQPPMSKAAAVDGWILDDACRWYALRVRTIDDSQPRSQIVADVVDVGRIRDFFGFNRARHAVVEAAILATRVDLLPAEEIHRDYEKLRPLVEKTGGSKERAAFEFLQAHIERSLNPTDMIVDMTG